MKIFLTGSILRDKDDDSRRNYVNVLVSIKEGTQQIYYHIRNYQANARSNAHRLLFDSFEDRADAEREYQSTQTKKLGRNRVEHEKLLMDFEDEEEFERVLLSDKLRLTVANARKIRNRVVLNCEEMKAREPDPSETFEESVERRIAEIDDVVEEERRLGVGKGTAALHGSSWGMF